MMHNLSSHVIEVGDASNTSYIVLIHLQGFTVVIKQIGPAHSRVDTIVPLKLIKKKKHGVLTINVFCLRLLDLVSSVIICELPFYLDEKCVLEKGVYMNVGKTRCKLLTVWAIPDLDYILMDRGDS